MQPTVPLCTPANWRTRCHRLATCCCCCCCCCFNAAAVGFMVCLPRSVATCGAYVDANTACVPDWPAYMHTLTDKKRNTWVPYVPHVSNISALVQSYCYRLPPVPVRPALLAPGTCSPSPAVPHLSVPTCRAAHIRPMHRPVGSPLSTPSFTFHSLSRRGEAEDGASNPPEGFPRPHRAPPRWRPEAWPSSATGRPGRAAPAARPWDGRRVYGVRQKVYGKRCTAGAAGWGRQNFQEHVPGRTREAQ